MSESEDPRGAEFIQASVERDQPRVIDATRLTSSEPGQPPYPGAERVLKVTVPVEPEITADCKLHLPRDQDRSEEIDIDPCGYIDPGEIEDDEYLQQLLVQTPDVDGPRVAGTDRQLLNIDLPMLMKLFDTPAAPDITLPERERFRQLRELIDTHERDHATAGSHAHTLIGPQTRSLEVWHNIRNLNNEDTSDMIPFRSVIYNELCAMVAERSKHPDITSRLAIDRYRLQNSNPEYEHALSILKWLRNGSAPERYSYDQITELLIEAGKFPHPFKYLTFALYDMATGMPLDDVIYNGTFHQKLGDLSRDEINKHTHKIRKNITDSDGRYPYYYTSVESVSIQWNKRAVIKEWWMNDPNRDISLQPIRRTLLNRLIANYTENVLERRFMPTTLPKQGVRGSAKQATLAAGMKFQDKRYNFRHPYQSAMAGNDDCLDAVHTPSDDTYTPYHKRVVTNFINWSNWFDDGEQADAWLEGSLFPR